MSGLTASENELGKALQSFVWADTEKRKEMQEKYGVNVVPCNFYSNIPSIRDIEESFEYKETLPPYENDDLFKLDVIREVINE